MDVVGQNIANQKTEGYTRQRVETSSIAAVAQTGRFSMGALPGHGVSIDGVSRLGDALLDALLGLAHGAQSATEHQHEQRQEGQSDQDFDQREATRARDRAVAGHGGTPPGVGRRSGRRLARSKLRGVLPSSQCTLTWTSCRRAACGALLAGVG